MWSQVQWSPHNETILASSGTDRRLHVWDLRYSFIGHVAHVAVLLFRAAYAEFQVCKMLTRTFSYAPHGPENLLANLSLFINC